MTHDELAPRKTDQRDRKAVEDKSATGDCPGEDQAAMQQPTARSAVGCCTPEPQASRL